MKQANTADLKSAGSNTLSVRFRSPGPFNIMQQTKFVTTVGELRDFLSPLPSNAIIVSYSNALEDQGILVQYDTDDPRQDYIWITLADEL